MRDCVLSVTEPGMVYEGYSIFINGMGVLKFNVGNSTAASLVECDLDNFFFNFCAGSLLKRIKKTFDL